jgi:peptide/nickel transport system substrate-binding protein
MKLSRFMWVMLMVASVLLLAAAANVAAQNKTVGDMRASVSLTVFSTPAEYKKATGKNVGAYKQSPSLDQQVASGTLPALKDRLPADPFVVKPDKEIGKYGGAMNIPDLWGDIWNDYLDEGLTDSPPNGEGAVASVAKSFEFSKDFKTVTYHLRQGLKWSDGVPFTVDDFQFFFEDVFSNDQLTPAKPDFWLRDGKPPTFKKIDDYNFSLTFATPYPSFEANKMNWGDPFWGGIELTPKHYLKQFHPKYTADADLQAAVKNAGSDTWTDLFNRMMRVDNPDRPTLAAWIPQNWLDAPSGTWVRNPYYFKVDTEGNQLPYIDKIQITKMADEQAVLLKVLAKQADWVNWAVDMTGGMRNYSTMMGGQQSGDYHLVYMWYMLDHLSTLFFNYGIQDPVKKTLYNDVRFRRAVSLAIDRDELNKLFFEGAGIPSQVSPAFGPPYNGEGPLFKKYTVRDLKTANNLLDQVGLTKRDGDGMRLGTDGKDLTIVIYTNVGWPVETTDVMEVVKKQLAEVGLRILVKPEEQSLWWTHHRGGQHDLSARASYYGGGTVPPELVGNLFLYGDGPTATDWQKWFDTNGKSGIEPPAAAKRINAIYKAVIVEPDVKKKTALILEAMTLQVENLWAVGIMTRDEKIGNAIIVSNRIGNVPVVIVGAYVSGSQPASWYVKY